MKHEDFDAWEQRIRDRAELLWIEDGSPDGPRERFTEEARELLAIEENPTSGHLDPEDGAEPLIEEASLMRNLGEFPTLVDQGEEQTYPDEEDDDIRLSDGDASDTGGVLPDEEEPVRDLPDAAMGEGDLTGESLDTGSARATMNPDINDDGLPDQPALDDDDGDGEDDDFDDDDDDEEEADEDDPDEDADDEEDEENARNDLADLAGVTVLGRP
jgi:hypothetical protein